MAIFDVRSVDNGEITEIAFADEQDKHGGEQAYSLSTGFAPVVISDGLDFVSINNKEHALNLIKALNKAIDLGWLV